MLPSSSFFARRDDFQVKVFYGGKRRTVEYKEVGEIFWQGEHASARSVCWWSDPLAIANGKAAVTSTVGRKIPIGSLISA